MFRLTLLSGGGHFSSSFSLIDLAISLDAPRSSLLICLRVLQPRPRRLPVVVLWISQASSAPVRGRSVSIAAFASHFTRTGIGKVIRARAIGVVKIEVLLPILRLRPTWIAGCVGLFVRRACLMIPCFVLGWFARSDAILVEEE